MHASWISIFFFKKYKLVLPLKKDQMLLVSLILHPAYRQAGNLHPHVVSL